MMQLCNTGRKDKSIVADPHRFDAAQVPNPTRYYWYRYRADFYTTSKFNRRVGAIFSTDFLYDINYCKSVKYGKELLQRYGENQIWSQSRRSPEPRYVAAPAPPK
jgi:hypothetical protein